MVNDDFSVGYCMRISSVGRRSLIPLHLQDLKASNGRYEMILGTLFNKKLSGLPFSS